MVRFFTRLKNNENKGRAEDINSCLRDAEKEIGKAKAKITALMEKEQRCKTELEECREESEKLKYYADKAAANGCERDAAQFIERKTVLDKKLMALQKAWEAAAADTENVKQMYDKLVDELESINERKEEIKSFIGR